MFRHHYRLGECRDCGTERVLRRRVPRHEIHLALTIGTLGLWGGCWIITLVAAHLEPWRCQECRKPQRKEIGGEEVAGQSSTEAAVGSGFALRHEHVD